MRKKFLYFVMVLVMIVFVYPLTNAQDETTPKNIGEEIKIDPNFSDTKMKTGKGARLTAAGATLLGTGILMELLNIVFITTLGSIDADLALDAASDFGLYNVLHITSATLISTGAITLLTSIGYKDDSITSKMRWRRTQTILGAVLLSVGSVFSIVGGGLYGSEIAVKNARTNEPNELLRITGLTTLGVGIPLTISGITSLITAFAAK